MGTKNKKIKWVIGIDEAGRGPLAGPVYVGVYAYPINRDATFMQGIKDSKTLTESQRESWYNILTEQKYAKYAYASISAKRIDAIGIAKAVNDAMRRALEKLRIKADSCEVLLDGGLYAPEQYKIQKTIIKGDTKVNVISAAAILAKVSRDKKMRQVAKRYPEYDLSKHKGYGTLRHRQAIQKFGIREIHRSTFCRNFVRCENKSP